VIAAPEEDGDVPGRRRKRRVFGLELDKHPDCGDECRCPLSRGPRLNLEVMMRGDAMDLLRLALLALNCGGILVQAEDHVLHRVLAVIQGVAELGREKSEPKDEAQDRGQKP
jgi:hypothetical protein